MCVCVCVCVCVCKVVGRGSWGGTCSDSMQSIQCTLAPTLQVRLHEIGFLAKAVPVLQTLFPGDEEDEDEQG